MVPLGKGDKERARRAAPGTTEVLPFAKGELEGVLVHFTAPDLIYVSRFAAVKGAESYKTMGDDGSDRI